MMNNILTLLLVVVSTVGGSAFAATSLLTVSDEQAGHLGVRLNQPQPVDNHPLGRAPAQVVLPPDNEYLVSARQAGLVETLAVSPGSPVTKGDIMAVLQSPSLLELERTLLDAASEFGLSRARLERDRVLLAEGLIARMRWLETQSQQQKAGAALEMARQTLIASGLTPTEVNRLESDHRLDSRWTVRSPLTGVVLERQVVTGQRVELLAPLFRVANLSTLWLDVSVPQERLGEMARGDRIQLENPEATARIIQVGQVIDSDSQTVLVRAVLEQGNPNLRPGMNVNVRLLHNSRERLFSLPLAALFTHESTRYVFVKTPAGYEARAVAVVGEEPHRVVIHHGLSGGESVVVAGVAALKAAWLETGEEK